MITEISAILSSIKSATDIAKILQQTDVSLEKAEAKLKLAELIEALADTKIQAAEVRDLLLEKDNEIRKLQDFINLKNNLVYEKPYYWLNNDEKKDGPFCQKCYDSDQKLVRLQTRSTGYWVCSVCKEHFEDSSYKSPQVAVATIRTRSSWVKNY